MSYTGTKQLTVGADGVVYSTAIEAIVARDTSDNTKGFIPSPTMK